MSKSPYPSVYQIEEMFQWRASADTFDKFDAIIDDHVQATMMGHDHHTAGEFQGKAAWKEGARARFTNMLDYSKPMKLDIVQVIGGGESPWACVEMKATGKAVNGKKYNHDYIYIVRFNMEGKISKMRVYIDSAHVNDHVEEHKKHLNGK